MEEQHYVARAQLRDLQRQHPTWTHQRFAERLGYSVAWVKKWRKRLRQAAADDEQVLQGLSRRRHTPYERPAPEVVQRILAIRDQPPEDFRRVPGPKAILHYLHKDQDLKAVGHRVPRSVSTIWRVLDEHGRIQRPAPVEHTPLEPVEPMSSWAIDYKDVTSVAPEPEGKQQHALESLNLVDEGSSFWLDYHLRGDFNAENTIYALALSFHKHGLPDQIRMDRDPRFVGPPGMRDFPSAFQRFLLCLGIHPEICPAHHPEKNPYVERFHGTLERECIQVERPADVQQTAEAFERFHHHFHHQRPHQGRSCNNQPPAQAFPALPQLPKLPAWVDPDRWVWLLKGKRFVRKVRAGGSITIDKTDYYIRKALAGQYVVVFIDARQRELVINHKHQEIKRIPLKGLQNSLMAFEDYLKFIATQAQSEQRRLQYLSKKRIR